MAGLFEGIPTASPTGGTSTTETPKWFQDLSYQQMMAARAAADAPFQQYTLPRVAALTPDQQAAQGATRMNVGAWQPSFNAATTGTQDLTGATAGFTQGMNTMTGAGATSALNTARPNFTAAGATSVAGIDQYMNPYNTQVTDRIAQLGARNLSENLLPAVSDQFVNAGQFGGSRMGEFGARALRDTQESVLGQQAGVLQTGYGQAMDASQTDLSRQLALGSATGSLATSDASRALTAGQNIASTAGSEALRRQGALQQMADLGQTQQGMHVQDAAALDAVGQSNQIQQQRTLDSAYQSWMDNQNYPKQQLDWLQAQLKGTGQYVPTTSTSKGYTTEFQNSPLSQLASGYFAIKGLTN